MSFVYEDLPSGMCAVFGSQKHYETTAVRVNFKAGSLHENTYGPPGVAHFLEHMPFQGTIDYPSLDSLNQYVEYYGMDINACTSRLVTSYAVNGMDLDKAMEVAFQLAFHPLLTPKALEDDRNNVMEEARRDQFDHVRPEVENYERLVGGPRYAQLIQGNIEDVARISHADIWEFYRDHYQIGNAMLIVTSAEPISRQRRIAQELIARVDPTRTKPEPNGIRIDLPWMTPGRRISSFYNHLDDEEAQSGVSMAYHLEIPTSFAQYLLMQTAEIFLNNSLYARIVEQLQLAYGSGSVLTTMENSNHNISEDYYGLEIHTQLHGSSLVKAIEGILYVEENLRKFTRLADSALLRKVLKIKEIIQGNPATTADDISESGQIDFDSEYEPRKALDIVRGFTAQDVIRQAAKMLSDRRVINMAGPSKHHLKAAEKFAAQAA